MGTQVHHLVKLTVARLWGHSENINALLILCLSLVARSVSSAANPGFILNKGVITHHILLGICNHSSAFEMYDTFTVRNDTGYLTASTTNFSNFPNLLIKNASVRDRGRYHCVLNYQGNRYISDKYVLTLKGNTIFLTHFKFLFVLIFY